MKKGNVSSQIAIGCSIGLDPHEKDLINKNQNARDHLLAERLGIWGNSYHFYPILILKYTSADCRMMPISKA